MNAIPTIWTTGTTEVFKTGTWRSALPQHIHAPSPCHATCPVGGDIAEWIGCARAGDFLGAWQILTRHNPFPAISGRICHHPCEAACNRAAYDEALAICKLERFVGDRALAERWSFEPVGVRHKEWIAVVGGGPSGLSAAFHLRRRGYAVTIFESRASLGGLMRHGIPPYRLPRSVLDREIARVLALGIDVRCGAAIRSAEDFELVRREFDAVYVAIGASRQKRLPLFDYAQPWVHDGADYLAHANAGVPPPLGRRVVVIGGGSAAVDVARTARRAGHAVTIVALESVGQLPAQDDEITEALEEGVGLIAGAMVTDVAENDRGIELRCVEVQFEPGATRGAFTVTPIADSAFSLGTNCVITAIGQDPDLEPLAVLDRDGAQLKVDRRQATSAERVYAGGDAASMARFVTEAIGMGKRAARELDRALRGATDESEPAQPIVARQSINTFYHAPRAREQSRRIDPKWRAASNTEVQLGFYADQALAEAERCFSCGTCIRCDNCVVYCPDLAVKRDGDGYVVAADYCKGCGVCVSECPTGSMRMVEEAR